MNSKELISCNGCGRRIPYIENPDFHICNECYLKHQSFWENKQREADKNAYASLSKKGKIIDALISKYLNTCGYAFNVNFKSHRYQLIRFLTRKGG